MVYDTNTDIYVNQVYKGKGTVTIKRMGPPKTIHVEARHYGRTVGEAIVKRKFDFATFLAGYFSYGTGFIWGWRFPGTVIIPVETRPHSGFDQRESAWYRPPSAWKR